METKEISNKSRGRNQKPEEETQVQTGPPIAEEIFAGDRSLAFDGQQAEAKEQAPHVPMKVVGGEMDKYSPGEAWAASQIVSPVAVDVEMLNRAVDDLRAILRGEIDLVREQIHSALTGSRVSEIGVLADMVGGIFNCPKCGLRLNTPSTTGVRGQLYEHPFDSAPQLAGQQCELKGRKFKAPVVLLQFAAANQPNQPLTPEAK